MDNFEIERIKTLEEKVVDLERKLNNICQHTDMCNTTTGEEYGHHDTHDESIVDKIKKNL